jgi:hypothetical protein
MTIVRAQEGTAARAFAEGSFVDLRVTAGSLDEFSVAVDVFENYYICDASATDQADTANSNSIKSLVNTIGTSLEATIVLPHSGTGNTTAYNVLQALDLSTYDNINFVIQRGSIITSAANAVTIQNFGDPDYQIFSGTAISILGQDFIRPEWWGADNTGSDDCKAAIDSAVNSISATGGTIRFSVGTYKIASALANFPIGDILIKFKGVGGLHSKINFTATGSANLITVPGTNSDRAYFYIEDMYLVGNSSSGDALTVSWATADGFRMTRCRIQSFGGSALVMDNSNGASIRDSLFYNNNANDSDAAIELDTCPGVVFSGTQFSSNTNSDLLLDTCNGFVIDGGFFADSGDTFLKVIATKGGRISSKFEDSGTVPETLILIGTSGNISYGITITGCDMSRSDDTTFDSAKAPIILDYAFGCTVYGNVIRATSGTAGSTGVSHVIVTANASNCELGSNDYFNTHTALGISDRIVQINSGATNTKTPFLWPKTYIFYENNFQTSQSGTVIQNGYADDATLGSTGLIVPFESHIVGIEVSLSAAVNTSTLDIYASGDGGDSTLLASFDGSGTHVTAEQHPLLNTATEVVAAGTVLKVKYDTSGTFAPNTLDGVVRVHVLENREE